VTGELPHLPSAATGGDREQPLAPAGKAVGRPGSGSQET